MKAGTDLPVALGFGVRTPEEAAEIAKTADGVVVGSALVEIIVQYDKDAAPYVRDYVESLSDAIASAR